MLKKLKMRLTLLNSAVVLAILLAIMVLVFVSFSLQATDTTDTELMNDAYMLKRFVPLFEGTASQQTELGEEYTAFRGKLNSANISYGIWDVSGNSYVYVSSYPLPDEALCAIRNLLFAEDTRAIRTNEEADGTYSLHVYRFQDIYIRVCTTAVCSDLGQMRIIQTVMNMKLQESMTAAIRSSLILAIILGVLLSLVTGYLIAGNSIRPVQQSIEQQKTFITDASHELRTPITIMKTNLDVVRACPEDTVEESMEWIDSAYRETEHMQMLVDTLLQMAKSDAGSETLSIQQFFAYRVCLDAKNRFEPIASGKGITLRFDNQAKNAILSADYPKTLQLLSIVLDNAIKYSSEGQEITIRLRQTGARAVIEIQDHGIGIDKSELENIFNRFYRTDKARSRKEGGTGLGLAIAKQIAEAHGGSISAESVKGRGTTVIIALPAV